MAIIEGTAKNQKQKQGQQWETARATALQNLLAGEQEQKSSRGLVGNIIGGFTDPISRIFESGRGLAAGSTAPMSFTSQEAYKADPTRFIGQRLADVGSLGLMAVPGVGVGGSVGKAALLGAGIGGLSSIGGAGKDENPLNAGLGGAVLGGVTGGALQGLGNFFSKKGTSALGNRMIETGEKRQEPDIAGLMSKKATSTSDRAQEFMYGNKEKDTVGIYDILRGINNGKTPNEKQLLTLTGTAKKDVQDFMNKSMEKYGQNQVTISTVEPVLQDLLTPTQYEVANKILFNDFYPKATSVNQIGTTGEMAFEKAISLNKLRNLNSALGKGTQFFGQEAATDVNAAKSAIYHAFNDMIGNSVPELSAANNVYSKLQILESLHPKIQASVAKGILPDYFGPMQIIKSVVKGVKPMAGRASVKTGEFLQGGTLPGIGGLLSNPAVQKGAEFLPGQIQGQEQQLPDMGIESAIGSQDTSSMSREQRGQLFTQLIGRGYSPNEAKTVVDMLMPEATEATAAQQKKAATGSVAAQTLRLLQAKPSMAGKISTVTTGVGSWLGGGDPDTMQYQAYLSRVNNAIKMELAGASLTGNERALLRGLIIENTDEAPKAAAKLQAIMQLYGQ